MPLPISTTPIYKIKLPVSEIETEFRPFLVKEEKVLLIASETKDPANVYAAIKNVVKECTFGKLNIDDICTADMEYFFVNLRAKSAGETATPMIKCEKCETPVALTIDLTQAKVNTKNYEGNNIKITDKIGVIMKFPNYEILSKLKLSTDPSGITLEDNLNVVVACIDKIYDDQNVYDTKDYTMAEIREFLDSLTQGSFAKLIRFFESMPILEMTEKYQCAKCGNSSSITFRGMQDFFS